MGDVTKDFSRREFACRCNCGLSDPHPLLVCGLQWIRTAAGRPLWINSGCRCKTHNRDEGGGWLSFHLPQQNGYCFAADWWIEGANLGEMFRLAEESPVFAGGGIGVYLDDDGIRIHSDVRLGGPVRWGIMDGAELSPRAVIQAAGNGVFNG